MPKQYGFLYEELVPEDYVFGSQNSLSNKFSGRQVLQESGDWSSFLPVHEKQAPLFETNACVTFGTLNALEILRKRIFDKGDNFSDRMLAKLSGTDPQKGNFPKKVADTLKKLWTVYEHEYPMDGVTSSEDYYKEVPDKLKTLAVGRGAEYEFGYEVVSKENVREALKYSPLGMSVNLQFLGSDGIYTKQIGSLDNHWICVWGIQPNGNYLILDTYYPFIKEYKGDPAVIFSYYLKRQVQEESFWQKFVKLLESFFIGEVPVYPDDKPLPPAIPAIPPVPQENVNQHKNILETFCLAIKDYEGWIPPGGKDWSGKVYPTGSPAYRNNNPGNLKALSGSFLKFPSYAEGMKALEDYVIRVGTGHHKAYPKGGNTTVLEFFKIYAPSSDKNYPDKYASFVATKVAVGVDYPISKIIT